MREMTEDERLAMQGAIRPPPTVLLERARRSMTLAAAGLVVLAGFGVAALAGLVPLPGGLVAAILGGGGMFCFDRLADARRDYARERRTRHDFQVRAAPELERMLEDGRVAVKRVGAVAVVEIEPIEDEGYGYIFDLGDGRILFLKGQDYDPVDEEIPWPNTDFEIVRAVTDGRWIDLYCHGEFLPPVRVVRREECDPQAAWDEREEVLHLSLDDTVKTILRAP